MALLGSDSVTGQPSVVLPPVDGQMMTYDSTIPGKVRTENKPKEQTLQQTYDLGASIPTVSPQRPLDFGGFSCYNDPGLGLVCEAPAGDQDYWLESGRSFVISNKATSAVAQQSLWSFNADKTLTLLNGATLPAATALSITSQAQGDILYFNGTAWVRLAPGTSGQVLQTNGAGANPMWIAGTTDRSVKASHNAAQAIPDNVDTVLSLNSENYDTDTMHSTISNTSRITYTTAGKYHVSCTISFAANATGVRFLTLRLNGTTALRIDDTPAISGSRTVLLVVGDFNFAANDYVEILANQTSGVSLDVDAIAERSPYCEAHQI